MAPGHSTTQSAVKLIDNRNSRQRRADNIYELADGQPVMVIYNGSRIQEILSIREGQVYIVSTGARVPSDYVFALDVKARTLNLRLRATRGIL